MCHEVALHSEKIEKQDQKLRSSFVQIQYRIPTSSAKTTTFTERQKENDIGKILANDWELSEFLVSIDILNLHESPYFDFSRENPQIFTDVVLEVEGQEFHVCKTVSDKTIRDSGKVSTDESFLIKF